MGLAFTLVFGGLIILKVKSLGTEGHFVSFLSVSDQFSHIFLEIYVIKIPGEGQ